MQVISSKTMSKDSFIDSCGGLFIKSTQEKYNFQNSFCPTSISSKSPIPLSVISNKIKTFEMDSDSISSLFEEITKAFSIIPPITKISNYRDSELQWLENNRDEIKKYSNQWIVVEGDNLIGSSRDIKVVYQKAKQNKIVNPFIIFIPEEASSDIVYL